VGENRQHRAAFRVHINHKPATIFPVNCLRHTPFARRHRPASRRICATMRARNLPPPGTPRHATYAYDLSSNFAIMDAVTYDYDANAHTYATTRYTTQQNRNISCQNTARSSSEHTYDDAVVSFYGYRYYSPNLGRWVSRDPIGEKGGKNIYIFCRNNGPVFFDALGLAALPIVVYGTILQRYADSALKANLSVGGESESGNVTEINYDYQIDKGTIVYKDCCGKLDIVTSRMQKKGTLSSEQQNGSGQIPLINIPQPPLPMGAIPGPGELVGPLLHIFLGALLETLGHISVEVIQQNNLFLMWGMVLDPTAAQSIIIQTAPSAGYEDMKLLDVDFQPCP
jgi:RHS repeat-associated protein